MYAVVEERIGSHTENILERKFVKFSVPDKNKYTCMLWIHGIKKLLKHIKIIVILYQEGLFTETKGTLKMLENPEYVK